MESIIERQLMAKVVRDTLPHVYYMKTSDYMLMENLISKYGDEWGLSAEEADLVVEEFRIQYDTK